jgi:proteasome lid subunit RPN8/RPN11
MTWDQVEVLLQQVAKEMYGVEVCGYIATVAEGKEYYVYPIENAHIYPDHNYLMSNLDQARAFDDMGLWNLHLVGAYHTHPSRSTSPSKDDIHSWRYPPEFWMVIATDQEVKVWVFDGEELQEQEAL